MLAQDKDLCLGGCNIGARIGTGWVLGCLDYDTDRWGEV